MTTAHREMPRWAFSKSLNCPNYHSQDMGQLFMFFNCSTDGITWQPAGREWTYYGGLTELGWYYDLAGNVWGVGRNEDGDDSGWGSRLGFPYQFIFVISLGHSLLQPLTSLTGNGCLTRCNLSPPLNTLHIAVGSVDLRVTKDVPARLRPVPRCKNRSRRSVFYS